MSALPFDLTPEALRAESAALRAVSRALLGHEQDAEDAEQETWLAALRSPPVHAQGRSAWLARVARNVALRIRRKAKARRRWDREAARPESLPSTLEAVERVALHQQIVEAVLALDEPYRTTIVLRFWEDRPPRDLARLMGVPVSTVRTRVRRSLAILRDRLDRSCGDRAAWSGLLALGVGKASDMGATSVPAASPVLAGVALMTAKVTLLAAAIGAVALFWLVRTARHGPESGGEVAGAGERARTADDEPPAAERQELARTSIPTSVARLIVVDAWGHAMSDVGIWTELPTTDWHLRSDHSFLGVTGEDGEFLVPVEAVGENLQVGRPGFLTQRVSVGAGMTKEIELPEGGVVRFLCRLGDGDGEGRAPIPDVDVIVAREADSVFPQPDRFPAIPTDPDRLREIPADGVPNSPVDRVVFRGRSGVDGLVELRGLPSGPLAWCASGKNLVLSDGPGQTPPDVTPVLADGTVHELVFVRLMAAGYRVVGDEVVSSRAQPVPRFPPRIAPVGSMVRHLIEKRTRDAFPGAMVFVLSGSKGAVARVTLVLRERGRHEFEVPFLPVEEFERVGPVLVDAAALAHEGTASEALTLRILDPDGAELPRVPGHLLAEDETLILPAVTGRPALVPHGRYRFVPAQEIVRNCLPREGRIEVDGSARDATGRLAIDMVLSHVLRSVAVIRPDEITQVRVVDEDSGLATVVNLDPATERTIVFLPDGRRFRFALGDTETVLARVDLSVPMPEPVTVRLETGR